MAEQPVIETVSGASTSSARHASASRSGDGTPAHCRAISPPHFPGVCGDRTAVTWTTVSRAGEEARLPLLATPRTTFECREWYGLIPCNPVPAAASIRPLRILGDPARCAGRARRERVMG